MSSHDTDRPVTGRHDLADDEIDAALESTGHHGPVHHHRPSGSVGRLSHALVETSMARPRLVFVVAAVVTVVLGAMFVRVDVDTDPENTLASDAPIRLLNAEIRETFGTRDLVVVGLFADEPVTDAATLAAAVDFHDEIVAMDGVTGDTVISPRTGQMAP